ncbi:GCFC-domain-containing protein [Dentipellis sp. KUC8613]|nr:GCFC-domain-containing protein [Dentipellis sp. KUC8613]
MADSPIIFKRTKAKHTQRARETPAETPVEQPKGEEEPSPSSLATKVRNKAKQRAKPKSNLSFGGEEDGGEEIFQVKKSSLSRKLTLGKHPASPGVLPTNLDQASISPQPSSGPIYDAAYLSELKASTPSARPPLPKDATDVDVSMDVDDMGVVSLDAFGDGEATIPSESSVLAAKQKRERMRTTGGTDEDFISLSVTKREDVYQGPHPESRLMREEDDLGEGDDEFAEFTSAQERIALGKKSRKAEAGKRRDAMKEMIADAEEVDEETEEWEQEQLRRGGMSAIEQLEKAPVKPVYRPAPIPPLTSIPSLDAATARLTTMMTSLTTSHAQHTASMASLSSEHKQLDDRESDMRDMVSTAEEKRSWFAAFREWMESVATFLDEKFPQLEKLEEEHISIIKEKRDMIRQRRHADDEDDLSYFLGSLPVPPHTEPEELDELGRIIPRANPAAARRDRRSSRIARRSHRKSTEEEGFSTDAELPPSDATDYHTALQKLAMRRDDILSDVKAKEFKDPSLGVGKWFGEWRRRFTDSYVGAWGGLGMISAWEFWVRLEIIGWNPLEDPRSLDNFGWYEALYRYSRPSDNLDDGEEPQMGPDGDLVAAMISTCVLPRLSKIVESGGLDPNSSRDVRRVVDLAEEIEISVEKNNPKFQNFLKTVVDTFKESFVESYRLEKQYLDLNQSRFDPEAVPARRRLLTRQRKLLTNILRWRRYTGEQFGIGELVTKLVENCMMPIAESGWDVGGEESLRKVAAAIPAELIPWQLKARLGA